MGISPIIKNQGGSLAKLEQNIVVDYYSIKGKGIIGYLKNIPSIRRKIKTKNYNIVHAHYSLSAIIASLAGAKPLIVSLMGSDVKAKKWFKFILWFFYKYFWSRTIVKSVDMKKSLGFKHVTILPNGVDMEIFKPMNISICQQELGWDINKTHLLFAANPDRYEKNYSLALKAIELLDNNAVELHYFNNIPNYQIPVYLNAANVVILTSLWEGSPNVIKEAMACNRPIVSTNVGDIEWLFGNENGYFLTPFDSVLTSQIIKKAIDYSIEFKNADGRIRLINLGLSAELIAEELKTIYKSISK